MKKLLLLMTLLIGLQAVGAERNSYVPPNGFVPDEKTAIDIAKAIWSPIYGEEKIKKEKPFHAVLSDNVWTVTGTLPKGLKGGVAIVEIAKEDGRILYVSHGK